MSYTIIDISKDLITRNVYPGDPVPELSVGDIEYNKMLAKYADDLDRSEFVSMLSRSVYNRLDTVLNLARQAGEKDYFGS